jgi:hypothetical protein
MTRALPLLLFRSLNYSPNISSHGLIWYLQWPKIACAPVTIHDLIVSGTSLPSGGARTQYLPVASSAADTGVADPRVPVPLQRKRGLVSAIVLHLERCFPSSRSPPGPRITSNRLAGNWNFYAASIPIHTGCTNMDPMQLICHVSLSRNSTADHN